MTLEQIEKVGKISNLQFLKIQKKFLKIKEVDRKSANSCLGDIITKASNLIGLKGSIEFQFKADIVDLIYNKYASLSLEEINKAFEMDRHSSNPVEHFQLFNSTYVSKVISNYIFWKKEERKRLNLHLQQNEVLKLSEEEIKENRKKLIEIIYNEIKNREFSAKAWLIYNDVDAPNKDRIAYKEVVLDRVRKKYYKKEKENRTFKGEFEKFIKEKQGSEQAIYNECKSILISEYLKPFVNDFELFKSKIKN